MIKLKRELPTKIHSFEQNHSKLLLAQIYKYIICI